MYYSYPKQAHFGKMIAKSKIYEHANVSSSVKEKFVTQIDKITWQYKLAPETINLSATPTVPEVQIFDIRLKGKELDEALMKVIDKAIPFPIIYQIYRDNEVKIKAAYKRPSDADKNKWVVESYFESEWIAADTDKESLPVALDLGRLYEEMIKRLMPQEVVDTASRSSIKDQVALVEEIKVKERAYAKLKAKRNKEKQFNKKVKINEQLHKLSKELEEMKKG